MRLFRFLSGRPAPEPDPDDCTVLDPTAEPHAGTAEAEVAYLFDRLLDPVSPFGGWDEEGKYERQLLRHEPSAVVDGIFAALRTGHPVGVQGDSKAACLLGEVVGRPGVIERLVEHLHDERLRTAVLGAFSVAQHPDVEPFLVSAVSVGRHLDWNEDEVQSAIATLRPSPSPVAIAATDVLEARLVRIRSAQLGGRAQDGFPVKAQARVEEDFRQLLMPPGAFGVEEYFCDVGKFAAFDGPAVVDGVFAVLRDPTFDWGDIREDAQNDGAFVLAKVLGQLGVFERLIDGLDDDRVRRAVTGAFAVTRVDPDLQGRIESLLVDVVRAGRHEGWDDDDLVSMVFVLGVSSAPAVAMPSVCCSGRPGGPRR